MKVRIGISLGQAGTAEEFADAVDLLEQAGGALFDESLTLLRLLLTNERVSFAGTYFTVDDVRLGAPQADRAVRRGGAE
jgi:alkanesulfonate monooxygenase SsuD/methylene tetrahydromethanopterin reductase-like flavin-dependent oxidoreductase (luciferase family)